MQDNTESENPENFSENEEHLPNAEETTPPENSDSPDPGFEDQEGELMPPDENKKSGAGKIFLFLILVLAGSGGYLYFNNLIPPEILNLVSPKPTPPSPPALITQTTPFEEAEIPEPVEVFKTPVAEPVTVAPPETPETPVSDDVAEPIPSPHISGKDFDPTAIEEEKALQETAVLEEAEPIIAQEVVEEIEFIREPVAETITPPEPASPEPEGPQRSKASQAYLDFIESSVQKLGQLIEKGFNWGWDYLKRKLV
ncbi:MAG: hypothetical protein H8E42_02355 [Nitrospinae bacterium]|nr:hypothetical protein [Nitrospinota bacterium]MBL7021193.1 hypothetical protein [Nitrospinaceae bacterium]